MNNYAIYYDYSENKNDLVILFKNKTHNQMKTFANVDVYLFDDEVISYVIHGINNVIKIYSKGIIHSPLKELIDVINIFLKKAGLNTLSYKKNSGFIIGKVISDKQIDINDKVINITTDEKLINQYVVVALPNTFIKKDKFVSDYYLCTYKDLGIDDEGENVFVIDEKCTQGKDFYLWESK